MDICTRLSRIERVDSAWLVHTNCADIKIIFVTGEIVGVRTLSDKEFMGESYVLMTAAWEDRLDPLLEGERTRVKPVIPGVEETDNEITFDTGKIRLIFIENPTGFELYDAEKTLLHSDLHGNPASLDSNRHATHYSCMEREDCFHGLSEKVGLLNKNKMLLRERATDAMGYDAEKADTLYKHIPFYIRLNHSSKKAVGVFYHNFYESCFNMGREKSNYWHRYTYWRADGGDIDMLLLGGNSVARAVDDYTLLTGRPALLSKHALGCQGSSMYYPELERDGDDTVLGFIDTIKEEGLPTDGFHFSSEYTSVGSKRCVFTWNTTRFKDPSAYFHVVQDKGTENVPNIKPGVLLCHPWFEEFKSQDAFVKDSKNPEQHAAGSWWGGPRAFWDFTKPAAREAWKKYVIGSLVAAGTNSIWNDNCEYDSLLGKDIIVDFDGKGGIIVQLKSITSTLMCKLSNDAVKEHDADMRPYSVCRSGSNSIQCYTRTWYGDNYTSWKSLKYNIPTIAEMGLSGQSNEGADIGDFAGPASEEGPLVCWVQQGILQARFSIHSASNDNIVVEPWMFKDSTDLIRNVILLRYRMAPYLYSCECEAAKNDAPTMRALVYEFQEDENTYDNSFDFLFRRSLLVASVIEKDVVSRRAYLPAGLRWYDMNDNYRCYEGGQMIGVPVTMETIPTFLREGAVLVMADNQLMNMECDCVEELRLITVSAREGSQFVLYDDSRRTNDLEKGIFRKIIVNVNGTDVVKVDFTVEGDYRDTIKSVIVEIIHKGRSPSWAALDRRRLGHYSNRRKFEAADSGWYYSQTKKAALVRYVNPKKDAQSVVSFGGFDLVGM